MVDSNKSQQNDEVELLQSILFDSINILTTSPYHTIEINIKPDVIEKPKIDVLFYVEFHADYPSKSIFHFKVSDNSNKVISSQFSNLNSQINTYFVENIGCPIVYQVVEIIKEYINDLESKMNDIAKKEIIQKLEVEVEKKINLLESRKFTEITPESYEKWFKKFMDEKIKEGGKELSKRKEIMSKPSGRQFFMDLKSKDLKSELDSEQDGEEDVDMKGLIEEEIKKNETEIDTEVFVQEDDLDIDEIDFDD